MCPYPYLSTAEYREYRRRYMREYRRTHGVKATYKPAKRIDEDEVPQDKQWKITGAHYGGRPRKKQAEGEP